MSLVKREKEKKRIKRNMIVQKKLVTLRDQLFAYICFLVK